MTIVVDGGGEGGTGIYTPEYDIIVTRRCYYLVALYINDKSIPVDPQTERQFPPKISLYSNVKISGYIHYQDVGGAGPLPCNVCSVSLYLNGVKQASTSTNTNGYFEFNVYFDTPGTFRMSLCLDNVPCEGDEATLCTFNTSAFKNCLP